MGLIAGCSTLELPQPAVDLEALTRLPEVSQACALSGGGVAFVSDASGDLELWFRAPDGTTKALTQLGGGVDGPTAARGSGPIVFAVDGGGDEVFDIWSVDPGGGPPSRITATAEISESSPRLSPAGDRLAVLADAGTPFRPQLHLLDRPTGALTALTEEPDPVWSPVWSPDGHWVAVVRTADWSDGALVVADATIGEGQPSTRVIEPLPGGRILWPRAFSPDSESVLVTTTSAAGFARLAVVGRTNGAVRGIGPERWDVEAAVWGEAGIVFTRNVAGRSGIYRMATLEAAVEELVPPLGVIGGLDLDTVGGLLFDRTDSATPSGLWRLGPHGAGVEALVSSGLDSLIASEPFEIRASDGTPLTGFVLVPPGRRGAGPRPTVAFVHGGPDGQSRDRFDADRQALAQAGFVVVDVNYRGSTGFGRAFSELDTGDWGGGDRRDIRDAVEHFIGSGLVDRDRVGIQGGSFGGYMVLLALALDGDLYRAGVDLYGMPDLAADFEMTKDRYEAWYRAEMGTPTDRPELFRERSPMTHIDRLVAPLLVFHGENDSDVPKVQSDALVAALRQRRRSIEYVVYPDEGHVFSKRKNRLDVLRRVTEFFRRNLEGVAPD